MEADFYIDTLGLTIAFCAAALALMLRARVVQLIDSDSFGSGQSHVSLLRAAFSKIPKFRDEPSSIFRGLMIAFWVYMVLAVMGSFDAVSDVFPNFAKQEVLQGLFYKSHWPLAAVVITVFVVHFWVLLALDRESLVRSRVSERPESKPKINRSLQDGDIGQSGLGVSASDDESEAFVARQARPQKRPAADAETIEELLSLPAFQAYLEKQAKARLQVGVEVHPADNGPTDEAVLLEYLAGRP